MKGKIQKSLAAIVMFVLVIGCFATIAPINAQATQTIYLKGSGSEFKETWNNIFYLGGAEKSENPNVWHLVYTGNDGSKITEMQLTFTNGEVFNWNPDMGFSTNGGGNNPGWVIVAPYGWEIDYVNKGNNNESKSFVVTNEGGNINFNISGHHKGSPDPVPEVTHSMKKTVNGVAFEVWLGETGYTKEDILEGISFTLHITAAKDVKDISITCVPCTFEDGLIKFSIATLTKELNAATDPRDKALIGSGWYVIKETFAPDSLAEKLFNEPELLYIDGTRITEGDNSPFDYTALYTIVNGYSNRYIKTLGYPGLNNNGDIFYIGVTNASPDSDKFGEVYASFCAHAGSKNFAGDAGHGCKGYMLADNSMKDEPTAPNYDAFVSAYNYIEDNYGNLNENRAITQVVTWILLGAIDVNSDAFEVTTLTTTEKENIRNVIDNSAGYKGNGLIADVVYMTCEQHGTTEFGQENCQPQLVPVYEGHVFKNTLKEQTGKLEIDPQAILHTTTETIVQKLQRKNTPYEEWTQYISQGYSSVTATTDAQLALLTYNTKNGNIDDKHADFNKVVVTNSNHFTFAKLSRADLTEGVDLTLVVGNKIDQVGTAAVKMVDGKLEITIADWYTGSFGAVAFDGFIPVVKNGNIHSVNIFNNKASKEGITVELYKLGSFQSTDKKATNYDKDWADITKGLKEDGYIYLYIHGDFAFNRGSEMTRKWCDIGEYEVVWEKVVKTDTVTTELEVTITVLDADGNKVDDLDNLAPGIYTIEYYDAYGDVTEIETVVVKAGETTVANGYSAEYFENADPVILEKYLPDIVNDLVIVNKKVTVK